MTTDAITTRLEDPSGSLDPDEALARLRDGNERFLRGEPVHTSTPKEVLAGLAEGQHPYAIILGCSDSRVPPELLFDSGFGDLFIIRVAGNVISPEVMGSIQYAGTHLETRLFVVLGHEGCGAVQAALAAKFHGAKERSRIARLLQDILPGLDGIDPRLPPERQLKLAVEANVRWSMRQILQTPEGAAAIAEGRMKMVGAVCEIATGRVRLLA